MAELQWSWDELQWSWDGRAAGGYGETQPQAEKDFSSHLNLCGYSKLCWENTSFGQDCVQGEAQDSWYQLHTGAAGG